MVPWHSEPATPRSRHRRRCNEYRTESWSHRLLGDDNHVLQVAESQQAASGIVAGDAVIKHLGDVQLLEAHDVAAVCRVHNCVPWLDGTAGEIDGRRHLREPPDSGCAFGPTDLINKTPGTYQE